MKLGLSLPQQKDRGRALLFAALCMMAMFSIVLLNGAPLFYFDTFGYFDQGTSILGIALPDSWLTDPALPASQGNAVTSGATTGVNSTVNGARSALFGLLLAGLYHAQLLLFFPALSVAIVVATVWLPMRIIARQFSEAPALWVLMWIPLIVASAGSLAFYVAYLMPDILAPLLILVGATLFAFGPQMQRSEIILASVIGLLAVFSHPSHLAMAAVMVPILVMLSLLFRRKGGWIAPAVMIALVGCGLGERLLFRTAVRAVTSLDVTYTPFLTARVIADGPGWDYLKSHCPDQLIQTCELYSALSLSENPLRLTATNIVFERTAELGSFRLMPRDIQKQVVGEQFRFVRDVAIDNPLAVLTSLARNTFVQAGRNSIQMTVPGATSIVAAGSRYPQANLELGRLISERSWIPRIERAHLTIYLSSLIIIALVMLWPGLVRRELKQFVLMALLGMLANDFVCGAVSQPADRYGARVIWLLPMLATLLMLFVWPRIQKERALE